MRKSHSFWVLAEGFWAYLCVEFVRWRVAGMLFLRGVEKLSPTKRRKSSPKSLADFSNM